MLELLITGGPSGLRLLLVSLCVEARVPRTAARAAAKSPLVLVVEALLELVHGVVALVEHAASAAAATKARAAILLAVTAAAEAALVAAAAGWVCVDFKSHIHCPVGNIE